MPLYSVMSKHFVAYLAKFIIVYCLLYYGTQLIIGLTVAGNMYSSLVHDYFDYVSLLRKSLLYASKVVVGLFGYEARVEQNFFLRIRYGSAVRMVYSCLGVGVFSFWCAFVIANTGKSLYKAKWIIGGVLLIWLINIVRICLLLIATNDKWKLFSIIDHHTLFNIVAYGAVFFLIYLFDRTQKKLLHKDKK